MNLAVCVPSTGGHEDAVESWLSRMSRTSQGWTKWPITVDATIDGIGAGYLHKVEKFYRESTADVLAYLHSDTIIHEHGWDTRVMKEFEDERVGVVSFCGAKRLGHPDIYKVPYDFRQLARFDFMSNLTDAENHGRRNSHEEDVAVVDSFSLIVARRLLDRVGGWPVDTYPPSHISDLWICLMAHRHGFRVRHVGVMCSHASGGVRGNGSFDYPAWAAQTKWGSDAGMHAEGHRLIYSQFRDILPVVIS